MSNKNFKFGFLIFTFLLIHNLILCQSLDSGEEFPGVTLERTEVRTLHSEISGQDFELFIAFPRSYSSTDTTYPVILVLDSYRAFSIVKGVSDALSWPYSLIPEVILIGIGYGGEGQEASLNWLVGRTRDLTPSENIVREEFYQNKLTGVGILDIDIETGGAPQFLDFIRKELFPFVESNYRIDTNQRMLSGYSAGGLFGLYTLFRDPNMFSRYFIGSPSITTFNDSMTFVYEINYANTHNDLRANVFMSVGQWEEENSVSMSKIADLLRSRNYQNLNLETVIFENESHATCYPAAISRGLIELFGNKND